MIASASLSDVNISKYTLLLGRLDRHNDFPIKESLIGVCGIYSGLLSLKV